MKIDHLGIAVRSLDEALTVWRDAVGLELAGTEVVAGEKVRVAFLPLGDSRIELLEATDASSTIARFVERRGEGVHHICVCVPDLEQALERLRHNGMRLVGEAPRLGAEGARVAFVHPASTTGVLLELKENRD